jgi:hypothetical protein
MREIGDFREKAREKDFLMKTAATKQAVLYLKKS